MRAPTRDVIKAVVSMNSITAGAENTGLVILLTKEKK
jgi:hypothetical protein